MANATKNRTVNTSKSSLVQRMTSTKLVSSTPTNTVIDKLPAYYIEFLAFIPIRWHIIYALSSTEIFPSGYIGTSRQIIDKLYQHKDFLTINFADRNATDFEHSVREALQYMSSGTCNRLTDRRIKKSPYNGYANGSNCRVIYTFN